MGKMMSQKEMVLQYIQRNGSITDMEAADKLGCRRLSGRVFELRQEGHDIEMKWVRSKNRYGKMVRYGEYYFGKEKK